MILAILLIGCQQNHKSHLQISGFETQVTAFEEAGAIIGKPIKVLDLIIRLGDIQNQGKTGLCQTFTNETPVITIDESYWNSANDTQKEILLFHEMGHCVLNINTHRNGTNIDGTPSSIMNYCSCNFASYYAQEHYLYNRMAYIKELFNQ